MTLLKLQSCTESRAEPFLLAVKTLAVQIFWSYEDSPSHRLIVQDLLLSLLGKQPFNGHNPFHSTVALLLRKDDDGLVLYRR